MSPRTPEKSLSDAIFEPITKAYKAGGLGLAFLGLGAFLMLVAFFLPDRGPLAIVVVATGFGLVTMTCTLFFFKDILPLFRVRRGILENSDLIDAVQAAALQMTEVASDLQAITAGCRRGSANGPLLDPQLPPLSWVNGCGSSAP